MKLQIDTTNKTIKLEGEVNLKELFKKLKELLPNDWEKFTLETSTVINNWNSPIVIREYPRTIYPWYWNGVINADYNCTSLSDNGLKASYSLTDGVFNVEV